MSIAALVAAAAALSGAVRPAPITDTDFDRLVEAAVLASVSTAQSDTGVICVQKELEPPLSETKRHQRTFREQATHSAVPHVNWQWKGVTPGLRTAFEAALAPGAPVARQREIASVSSPFVLFSKSAQPAQCDHRLPAPGEQPNTKKPFVLSFSRPVLAHGYAFIDETGVCTGLCGTGWLRVFKKQSGKWQQVASAFLWVS